MVLRAGPCAAEHYEPRQVREEAAVNSILWVPQDSLAGAGWFEKAIGRSRGQVHDLTAIMTEHHSSEAGLRTLTRELLRHFDLRARKSLGQHFLVDASVLKLIISAAELSSNDVVMEIGPGLGFLTGELARQAGWVVAIELDEKMVSLLQQTLGSFNNITIINKDVLQIEPRSVMEELKPQFPPSIRNPLEYKLVANLPYYITSAALRHFLEASLKPQVMVVMVQKEVAQAIVAKPGEMSILSISVQFYGQPEIIDYVPARSFYPAPEVDSAILRVNLYPEPPVSVDEKEFFKLVRGGFAARRKQIANSLTQGLGLDKSQVLSLLEEAGIEPKRRAETLTLEEWARLLRFSAQVGQG